MLPAQLPLSLAAWHITIAHVIMQVPMPAASTALGVTQEHAQLASTQAPASATTARRGVEAEASSSAAAAAAAAAAAGGDDASTGAQSHGMHAAGAPCLTCSMWPSCMHRAYKAFCCPKHASFTGSVLQGDLESKCIDQRAVPASGYWPLHEWPWSTLYCDVRRNVDGVTCRHSRRCWCSTSAWW